MAILNIYALSGLFYELYSPQARDFHTAPLDFTNSNPLRRTNSLFWARLFSMDSLNSLLNTMKNACYLKSQLSVQERAVLANPELFMQLAQQAPLKILDQGIEQREFFKWLEVLTISCKLFSDYIYYPFEITIQDGFLLPDFSTDKMLDIAMDSAKNPYFPFLTENVFPGIDKQEHEFIWINGQLKASSIAIAAYIKRKFPNSFVGVRNHSSEYYSLNKIETLLKNNSRLFSLVDCIVLDDNQATYRKIEEMISQGSVDFSNIKNVIYRNRDTSEIFISGKQKTTILFEACISRRDRHDNLAYAVPPSKIVNLRLNPNTQCFWRKCSFCGINEKYAFISDKEHDDMMAKCGIIKDLIDQGTEYLWFEDEAVTPESLSEFSDAIIASDIKFEWQVRSRIHFGFTKELCEKLYLSGLREIRFGLESACDRILKSMNKFDIGVNMDFVEEIIARFVSAGIHVHFPMIVGYPTESADERNQTYEFLNKMREKYVYFSFNINVLMLDVSSVLYKNFSSYDISSVIYPCAPSSFLGNMVAFDCADSEYSYEAIDDERVLFMSQSLYNWMPTTALTKSHIYYRLSETIRNTLIWSSHERLLNGVDTALFVKNKTISVWQEAESYYVYDWEKHNLIGCDRANFDYWNSIETVSKEEFESSEQLQEIANIGLLLAIEESEHE